MSDQSNTTDYNKSASRMLVDLRGGLPDACDFCLQPFTDARYPVPEEAGEWACSECEAQWSRERAL